MTTRLAVTALLFAGLLVFQWLAGIVVAQWISPLAWAGPTSGTHPHVWAAVVLGGGAISLPLVLALTWPGRALTRHAIAKGTTPGHPADIDTLFRITPSATAVERLMMQTLHHHE